MELYERLYTLRKMHSLSQAQLSEILNLSKVTYASYEQGRRTPPIPLIIKFANFYNINLDFLLGRSNNMAMLPSVKKTNSIVYTHTNQTVDNKLLSVITIVQYIDK